MKTQSTVTKQGSKITHTNILSVWNSLENAHNAEIDTKAGTIRIFGFYPDPTFNSTTKQWVEGGRTFDKTFAIGEEAEYDSYNMNYLAPITAIGAKTVSIKEKHDNAAHRLDLGEFIRRNWKLDVAAIKERNAAWFD